MGFRLSDPSLAVWTVASAVGLRMRAMQNIPTNQRMDATRWFAAMQVCSWEVLARRYGARVPMAIMVQGPTVRDVPEPAAVS